MRADLIAVAVALALAGCGGSASISDPTAEVASIDPAASTPDPPTTGITSTAGIWTSGAYTMFASDNLLFYQTQGSEFIATVEHVYLPWTINGGEVETVACSSYCQITTPSQPYEADLEASSDDLVQPDGAITFYPCFITPNQACPGVTWEHDSLYDDPSPLSTLEGSWSGTLELTIAPDGSFTAGSAACAIAGEFSTDDPTHNLYSVNWTYSGESCIIGRNSAAGIAYIDYSIEPVVLHIEAQAGTDIASFIETPNAS